MSERSKASTSWLSLLKQSAFVRLWLAQVLGQSGIRVFQISAIWSMMTGLEGEASSGLYTAVLLVGCALPAVTLAKPIGRLIDRSDVNNLMAAAMFLAGGLLVCAFGYKALVGISHSPLTYVALGMGVSLAHAVFDPCLQRSLSLLVTSESVPVAVSIVSSTQSAANFGGAVVGAFLLEVMGFHWLLACIACTYFVSALLARALPLGRLSTEDSTPTADLSEPSQWSLKREHPLLARVLLGFGLANFFASPIVVILPLYVRKVFGGRAIDLGVLEASVWIGLVAGTLLARQLTAQWSTLRTAMISLSIAGIGFALPSVIVNQSFYQMSLFVVGLAFGANNTRFITLFQEAVDDRHKGRFFALLQASIGFAVPISFLFFGLLGDLVSPQWLCLIQGLGVIALAGYFAFLEGSDLPVSRAHLSARADRMVT